MFEYQQNTLCVLGEWLWENGIISEAYFRQLVVRGKVQKITTGGNGRKVWAIYESFQEKFKQKIREAIKGDPYEQVKHIIFADYIKPDLKADEFFASYLLEDGTHLPEEKQKEYVHQAIIFNTVQHIATNVVVQRKFGGRGQMWAKMLEAVQNLPATWLHTRYKNQQSFKRAYKKYLSEGYGSIVSGKFLNDNSTKIKDDVAKFILAMYSLPLKYTIPEVLDFYNEVRVEKEWPEITERAVHVYLTKPEIERLWTLKRDGKEIYNRKFGHTLTRDRSNL